MFTVLSHPFRCTGRISAAAYIVAAGLMSSVASADTVLHLRFENDLTDSSVYNHTATATNGPGFSASVPVSPIPQTGDSNASSLQLTRSAQQYVTVAHDPSLSFGNSSFTIEAWVRLDTVAVQNIASRQYLVQKKATTGVSDLQADYGFLVQRGDNLFGAGFTKFGAPQNPNQLQFTWGDGSGSTSGLISVASSFTITDNVNWHYVSVSFDAVNREVRFVLDSQVEYISVSSGLGHATNSGSVNIGAHFTGTGSIDSWFDGKIDELRISSGVVPMDTLLSAPVIIPPPEALPAMTVLATALLRRRVR